MTHIVRLEALYQTLAQAGRRERRALILDEGPVFMMALLQALGDESLRTRALEGWWRDLFGRWAGAVDLIVWLDASDPVLTERIRNRDQAHLFKEADDPVIHAFLARYRDAYESVIARLTTSSGPRVLRIDTEREPPQAILGRVLATLDEMGMACRSLAPR
jgi:hypothetical protein